MVVPFAAMTAALQMLICTYGRSYREAQTYVSYLATLVSFVPLVVLFSGLKDAFWQLCGAGARPADGAHAHRARRRARAASTG